MSTGDLPAHEPAGPARRPASRPQPAPRPRRKPLMPVNLTGVFPRPGDYVMIPPLFNPDALWFEVCDSRPADIEGWCTVYGFYVAEDARPVGPPHNEFIPMHTILVRRPGWGVR